MNDLNKEPMGARSLSYLMEEQATEREATLYVWACSECGAKYVSATQPVNLSPTPNHICRAFSVTPF
jgi:hypothetical protein